MDLRFKKLDLDRDFDTALAFRRDSYQCSFGSLAGFEDEAGTDGAIYRAKLHARARDPAWRYYHLWSEDRIIGQLEFRDYSDWPGRGYVQLFYIAPPYRGRGLFKRLHGYVVAVLKAAGCQGAALSVSRSNHAALRAYERHGWYRFKPNPKHPMTDFYFVDF